MGGAPYPSHRSPGAAAAAASLLRDPARPPHAPSAVSREPCPRARPAPAPLRAPAPATRSARPCLAPLLESRWPGGHRGARSRSAHPASPPACTLCFLSPARQDDTAPLRRGGLRVRLRRHVTTHRACAQQSPAQNARGRSAAAGPGPPAPRPERARHCVSPEASAAAAKPLPKALGAPSLRRWRHVSEAAPRAPGSVTFLRGAVSGPGALLRPAEAERTEATHVSPATWKSPRRRAARGAGRRGGARRPQPVCSRPSPAPGPPVSGPSASSQVSLASVRRQPWTWAPPTSPGREALRGLGGRATAGPRPSPEPSFPASVRLRPGVMAPVPRRSPS